MTFPLEWTEHLQNNKTAKEDLELAVRNSTVALTRLLEILEKKKSFVEKTESNITQYEHPSWSHKQAHLNGRRASLDEIINLLQFIRG